MSESNPLGPAHAAERQTSKIVMIVIGVVATVFANVTLAALLWIGKSTQQTAVELATIHNEMKHFRADIQDNNERLSKLETRVEALE